MVDDNDGFDGVADGDSTDGEADDGNREECWTSWGTDVEIVCDGRVTFSVVCFPCRPSLRPVEDESCATDTACILLTMSGLFSFDEGESTAVLTEVNWVFFFC